MRIAPILAVILTASFAQADDGTELMRQNLNLRDSLERCRAQTVTAGAQIEAMTRQAAALETIAESAREKRNAPATVTELGWNQIPAGLVGILGVLGVNEVRKKMKAEG